MRLHNGIRRLIVNMISPKARQRRVTELVTRLQLTPGMRVIDLGGMPSFWRFCPVPLDVTIVNLDVSQIKKIDFGSHAFTVIEGDATNVGYPDNTFDLAFSNSTIEHVGDFERRAAFACEVQRLAPAYYVQTPSKGFPFEVHTGLPFWWLYPKKVRDLIIARWRRTNPALAEFVAGTTVVSMAELSALFPDSQGGYETMLGFSKSNLVWKTAARSHGSQL